VAGVYNVCTLPELRGLGIGRAITASVIEDARQQGMRVAVLGASPMGDPVYRAMGFREVCRLRSYFDPELPASQSGNLVLRSARQAS
jgi:ribosomal protein S18 acetylase RimI-like enzyme